MIKSILYPLFFIGFFWMLFYSAKAQELPDSTQVAKHTIGIDWNPGNLLQNYPALQFGLQYAYKNKWIIEVGMGRVSNAEVYFISENFMHYKSGYRFQSEARYIYDLTGKNNGSGLYVGIGYAHLESSFQTDYVIRKQIQNDRYYQNIDKEYQVKINQYYTKLGYRILTGNQQIFFDFGLNIGYSDKNISPAIDVDGKVLTNPGFANKFYQSPEIVFLDLKIGFILFQ